MTQILETVINAENHPVLLHCIDGANNTGLVIMCLRKLQNWDPATGVPSVRATNGHQLTRRAPTNPPLLDRARRVRPVCARNGSQCPCTVSKRLPWRHCPAHRDTPVALGGRGQHATPLLQHPHVATSRHRIGRGSQPGNSAQPLVQLPPPAALPCGHLELAGQLRSCCVFLFRRFCSKNLGSRRQRFCRPCSPRRCAPIGCSWRKQTRIAKRTHIASNGSR